MYIYINLIKFFSQMKISFQIISHLHLKNHDSLVNNKLLKIIFNNLLERNPF